MKFWYKVIYFLVSSILLTGCTYVQDDDSISSSLDENNTVEVSDNVDNNGNEVKDGQVGLNDPE